MNSGKESEIVADFVEWPRRDGWDVTTEVDFVDVLAERAGCRLVAEAKGMTTSPGLDTDCMYGQLLRRMTDDVDTTRYAVVVPEKVITAALRVPASIRDRLRIDVYGVDETGAVTLRGVS